MFATTREGALEAHQSDIWIMRINSSNYVTTNVYYPGD